MKKPKIILAAILAATINQSFAGGGGGGSIVFDPTNFAKNTITAAQSIAMEARQASMYATQLQQLATQLKQQAGLGSSSMDGQFNDVMNTYRTVQQYQSELTGLQGAVGDVRSGMDKRMNLMAASGLSWDQYIQRERDILKYRQDSNTLLSVHERQVMDNAAQRYAKVREIQPKIMGTQGTHESMQTMNTQMNMLTASMQDLITLSAAQGNRVSQETAERQAREQRSIDADEAYRKLKARQQAEGWATIEKLKTMDLGVKK